MKTPLFLKYIVLLILPCLFSFGQEGGQKMLNPYHKRYSDSLRTMEYASIFPILGKKAYKKGYDIPYPCGVSLGYFFLNQGVKISNTKIGFNDGEKQDLSGTIGYGDVINKASVYMVRPDLWLFPFMNIYAIGGYGTSETEVNIKTVAGEPVDFTTIQKFNLSTIGFGATFAGGVGPVFIAVDNNMNWANVEAVDRPVLNYNLGTRLGFNFVSPRHPDRNMMVWTGAFFQYIESSTKGSIPLSDVMSSEEAQKLKDELNHRIDSRPDLGPVEKKALETVVNEGLNKYETTTVNYELDKRVAGAWNMVLGVQYQYSKRWQARLELGALGQRSQVFFNLSYRFF